MAEGYQQLRQIGYKVDKGGRHIITRDVWVKTPGIDVYTREILNNTCTDSLNLARLESMCNQGLCYERREESPLTRQE